MYTNKEEFKKILLSNIGMDDKSEFLKYCQYNKFILDPACMDVDELALLMNCQNYIKKILIAIRDKLGNDFKVTAINTILIPNLSVIDKEWWYFYGDDLKEILPLLAVSDIHNAIFSMYINFATLYKNSIFDVILKEIETQKLENENLLTKMISVEEFTSYMKKFADDHIEMKDEDVSDFLLDFMKKRLLIDREYRSIDSSIVIYSSFNRILEKLYAESNKTADDQIQSKIEKLSQKLEVGNAYWWHLYDNSYLEFLSKICIIDIHSILRRMYVDLLSIN